MTAYERDRNELGHRVAWCLNWETPGGLQTLQGIRAWKNVQENPSANRW